MSKAKKIFLALTAIVFIVDIVLVMKATKTGFFSEPETTENLINMPSYEITTGEYVSEYPEETTTINMWRPEKPDVSIIINIEYYNQDNFPTFCEGVTTLMALRHMGYNITIDQLIENYFPHFELSIKDGKLVGENPNEFFIGNPRSSTAKGCYAPVVREALKKIAGEAAVHDLTGMEVPDIITQYVNKGVPVIFWATQGMRASTVGDSWYIERTGETFTWKGMEHCLLLAGSDEDKYYFYDPLNNHGIISYDKELVEKRYEEMGKMAVALVKRGDGN